MMIHIVSMNKPHPDILYHTDGILNLQDMNVYKPALFINFFCYFYLFYQYILPQPAFQDLDMAQSENEFDLNETQF